MCLSIFGPNTIKNNTVNAKHKVYIPKYKILNIDNSHFSVYIIHGVTP